MAMELNQQTNDLIINGYLRDKNLRHNDFGNGDIIMGSVDVGYKDGNKVNVQRVNVFASQYTRSGKENPSYKSITKVEKEYNAGKGEDGDRVHVKGRIDYNVFKTKSGDLVKTLRKNGAFFTRISKDDDKYTNQARAHMVLTVGGYEDQVVDGKPTGNKIVHNVNVGYNNQINVIPNLTFNMDSLGDDIDTIVNTFPQGSTIDAQINFNDYAQVQQSKQQAHGFGHHVQMSVATKFVHSAEIDYIEAEPVDGKQALTRPQISHAGDLLKQTIQQARDGGNKSKPKSVGSKNPFAPSSKSKTEKKISKDDVPFF